MSCRLYVLYKSTALHARGMSLQDRHPIIRQYAQILYVLSINASLTIMRERSPMEMRILITTIAGIALVIQAVAAFFDIFTMRKTVTLSETLFNDFVFISSLCSFIVVLIFILIYIFKNRFLENKVANLFFLYIVFYAAYVHLYQIFLQKDFILTSCILLPIDCYVVYKSIKHLSPCEFVTRKQLST